MGAEDDALVVDTVVYLLRSGRLLLGRPEASAVWHDGLVSCHQGDTDR